MNKKNCMLLIGINNSENSNNAFQEEALKKYALANNYNIVRTVIHDKSKKGFKDQSTNELVSLLDKNQDQFDVLLFTRWDRLSRNSETVQTIIKKLIELNKEYQAIEQPLYFDSLECKLIFEILLMIPSL